MKINMKLVLILVFSLFLTSGTVGFFAVYQIWKSGEMTVSEIQKIGNHNIQY